MWPERRKRQLERNCLSIGVSNTKASPHPTRHPPSSERGFVRCPLEPFSSTGAFEPYSRVILRTCSPALQQTPEVWFLEDNILASVTVVIDRRLLAEHHIAEEVATEPRLVEWLVSLSAFHNCQQPRAPTRTMKGTMATNAQTTPICSSVSKAILGKLLNHCSLTFAS